VATPQNEAQLLDYAQQATAEQVQRRCQQMHNADRAASTHDVNEIHRGRFLRRSVDGLGRMTISIELTEEAGALVMAALERAMAEPDASRDASEPKNDASLHARQADALVDMARAYLAGESARSRPQASGRATGLAPRTHRARPALLLPRLRAYALAGGASRDALDRWASRARTAHARSAASAIRLPANGRREDQPRQHAVALFSASPPPA
jgi:hypothetical protein